MGAVSPVKFYFATTHDNWERGTEENTKGLIRQDLPERNLRGATVRRRGLVSSQAHSALEVCCPVAWSEAREKLHSAEDEAKNGE